jgi:hypothetical protein
LDSGEESLPALTMVTFLFYPHIREGEAEREAEEEGEKE